MRDACIILGAGGHSRVLLDCLRDARRKIHGLLDPKARGMVDGVRILGGDDLLPQLRKKGIRHFVVGVGDLALRRDLFNRAMSLDLVPMSVIHPSAIVSPSAVLRAGCQVLPGAIINAGATIGSNTIINTGAIVEHDCAIGDHSHIATGARIAGSVTVGTGTFVGAGALIRQSLRIGDRSLVAMGAVVVKNVPSGVKVAGVPASRMS